MVTVTYGSFSVTGDKAARSDHDVVVYDSRGYPMYQILNIWDDEWNFISIENGNWLDLTKMPDEKEVMKSEIASLQTINHQLTEQLEQQTADLDFCLMMLEE